MVNSTLPNIFLVVHFVSYLNHFIYFLDAVWFGNVLSKAQCGGIRCEEFRRIHKQPFPIADRTLLSASK